MEENIFYTKDDQQKNDYNEINSNKDNSPTNNEQTKTKDELITSLPSWDLEPPYEQIRRVIQ